MAFTRRDAVLGGLAGIVSGRAHAAEDLSSPIAHGILEQNSLAKEFEPSPQSELPEINIWGPQGKRSIRELKGRTLLMPLWAEWCAPCISELPDFARLQKKYGNAQFAIVPVLTSSLKRFTPQRLGEILAALQAGIFEPLIEDNWGARLTRVFAKKPGAPLGALPCNLLIAPDGRVVARAIGRTPKTDLSPAKSFKETFERSRSGEVQSRWGEPDGEAFAAAMADRFLA